MDRRLEVDQLPRSIATLSPGAGDTVGREDALRLLDELGEVKGRLDDLKRRLREPADEVQSTSGGDGYGRPPGGVSSVAMGPTR